MSARTIDMRGARRSEKGVKEEVKGEREGRECTRIEALLQRDHERRMWPFQSANTKRRTCQSNLGVGWEGQRRVDVVCPFARRARTHVHPALVTSSSNL